MKLINLIGLGNSAIGLYLIIARAQTSIVPDLNTLLSHEKKLSSFYSIIQRYPQILLQLPSYSGVTILAPNNEAFGKIPYTVLSDAFNNENHDVITNVLEYHILLGTKDAAHLMPGTPAFLPTLLTSTEWTNVSGGQRVQNVKQAGNSVVFVSGQGTRSTLMRADLAFTGGRVQIIDSILIPPSNITKTAQSLNLNSFQGALYSSGQISELILAPDLTVFAPNNQAFEVLGPAITNMTVNELGSALSYHVLPQTLYSTSLTNGTKFPTLQGGEVTISHSGNDIYVNSAQIITTDILLANGVLHVIDNVLNPQEPEVQPDPKIVSQAPVFVSASEVDNIPFASNIPCTSACSLTMDAPESLNIKPTGKNSLRSSSSKALGATIAQQTGVRKSTSLIVAIGGAIIMA